MAEKTQYPEFMELLRAEYIRPQRPTLKWCYDRVCCLARARDLDIPSLSTARRLMKANNCIRIVMSGQRVQIDGRSFSTSAPIGTTVIVYVEPPPREIVHVYSLDYRTYFGVARPMEEPLPPVIEITGADMSVDDAMEYTQNAGARTKRAPGWADGMFEPTLEELQVLRHRASVQRVKEVLKIIQAVQLHGLPSDSDAALDDMAQEIAMRLAKS